MKLRKIFGFSVVQAAALAAGFSAFAANTWYVDAENGNDAWNGKADFANAEPGSNVGPKKTLCVFTNLLANGDTIYAAPGWYTNGVASSNFRFDTSKTGISLIATGSATNTFIGGAADETVNLNTSPFGCGSNAIVPVRMKGSNSLLKGFTIFGGRQIDYSSAYGGGVVFSQTGYDTSRLVDCVVTNCIASRGGGVYWVGYALRCRFTGNLADHGSHGLCIKTAVNCIFENTEKYAVYNNSLSGTVLNCLFRRNKTGSYRTNGESNGATIDIYNSVLLLGATGINYNKHCYFRNCILDNDPSTVTGKEVIRGMDDDCRIFSTGSLRFNADGSPAKGSPAIGAANSTYYDDSFPTELEEFGKEYDFTGNARVVGDAMDIGAVERTDADRIDDNDWYVDAENGNDAWNGKVDLAHAVPESGVGPKKTLAAIADGRVAGDIIFAAPGVYSNGTVLVDSQLYRVKIPAGVSLVGVGGAENTVILGESSDAPDSDFGTGPNAVSCVYLQESDVNSSIVGLSGFTLSGGYGVDKKDSRGSAVRGSGMRAGIVEDCIVTNCVVARGPVFAVGAVLRCRFFNNTSVDGAGGAIMNVNYISDSYFRNSWSGTVNGYMHDIYQTERYGANGGFVVNCTFDSDGTCGAHVAGANRVYVYNSIIKNTRDCGGACYFNCVTTSSLDSAPKDNGSEKDESTIVTNRDAVALTAGSYRPVAGFNPAVGAGDYVLYTNLLPAAVASFVGKDLWGNPRLVGGRLDIGAVACDRAAVKALDTSNGLVSTGVETDGLWHDAEAGASYTLSRNYTSPKLLLGVDLSGEYIDFNAHDDDWVYEGTLPADGALEITPVYAEVNDWYVDAVNGSDLNDGLRPGAAHAFKTLARASTNALMEANATVYVAEGVYNTGVVPAVPAVDQTASRMLVPYRVNFVASGRREATIVEGASDDTPSGIGPNAVRCCLMRGGSLRGFTLRNGNVNLGSANVGSNIIENDKGGGIRSTSTDAYAYDCEITGCNAVRGGGANGVKLVRCYLHGNTVNVTGIEPKPNSACNDANNCSAYNSVITGDVYQGGPFLNCTLGRCWGNRNVVFANCYVASDGAAAEGVAAVFTNCVCATAFKSYSPHEGCVENTPCLFDANNRPRRHSSPLVNAGDNELYTLLFPAALSEYAGIDFVGGERVLEGCIDIGAGEMVYDPTGLMIILK